MTHDKNGHSVVAANGNYIFKMIIAEKLQEVIFWRKIHMFFQGQMYSWDSTSRYLRRGKVIGENMAH